MSFLALDLIVIISSSNSLSPEEKDKVTVYCPEQGCTRTWIDPAAGCRHLKNAHGYKPHHRPDFVSRAHPKSSVPSSSKPKPKTKSAGVKKRTTKKEVQSPTIKKEELTPTQMQTQTHMQTFQDENQEAMDAATWTAQACRELAQFLLSCSQSEPSTPSASSPASPSYSSLSASALTPESSLYSTPEHSPSGSSPSSASPPLRTPSPWENLVLTYPDDEELYIANQRELTLHEPVPQYPQQQQYQYQDASVAQCGEPDADSILEFFSSVIEYQRCLPSLDASMNADTAMTFDIDMDGTTDPALFNAGYDASSPGVIGLY